MFDDWMDRYAMLIEMGKECPIIDDQYRDEKHLINGCQSRVWLSAELKDGRIYFAADSDAVITKGIIFLLIKVFSGGSEIFGKHPETQKPEEAHRRVGHDENACDDKGIDGGRVKESGIESGLGIFYFFPDTENDVGVGRHENHGGKTDEKLAVEQQVKAEKLNYPTYHAWMVKVTPVGEFGVCPVIDFIIAKFKPSCQKASY